MVLVGPNKLEWKEHSPTRMLERQQTTMERRHKTMKHPRLTRVLQKTRLLEQTKPEQTNLEQTKPEQTKPKQTKLEQLSRRESRRYSRHEHIPSCQ